MMGDNLIFQKNGVLPHKAKVMQEQHDKQCADFTDKDSSWTPNSPDLNALDYHVWGEAQRAETETAGHNGAENSAADYLE